ncbi:MAG: hypothetical protein AB7R90_04260 [Reyranellaceae bacterium]
MNAFGAAAPRIRPPPARGGALAPVFAPILAPALALVLGLALVVAGFPRFMAALYAVSANDATRQLDASDPGLGPAELLAARQGLRYALAWEGDGATAVRLARVTLALAAREYRAGGNPLPLVEETIEAARRGLAAAPAQARGWLLLAEAMLARTGDPGAVVPFLLEAIRASPHDIWMAPHRAELGLRAWPWLEPQARALVSEQIRLSALRRVDGVVAMARRAGDPGPVREALAADAERLRQFDVLYLQHR